MITASIVALIAISGLAHSEANGVPKFSWSGKRNSDYGIPHLTIHFPDGDSDVALLERFNPIPVAANERGEDVDPCIFRGYLQAESDVYVTLTGGCPFSDSFELTIPSAKLTHQIYSVKNGQVTGLTLPWGNGTDQTISDLAVKVPELERPLKSGKPIARADFPESGMVMKVKLLSDSTFRAKFGMETMNAMRRVMAHAQAFYYLKDSLTTTIRLEIVATGEVEESITASSEGLELIRKYATDKDVDANVHMCYENDSYGVVGLAWVGTTCHWDLGYRSSIDEYFFTDAQSGWIVAHETGHNLGMHHDFTNYGPRFDSQGNPCTGIGGVMDYDAAVKWSTCSVEDFRAYYNQHTTFCLPADDTSTTTEGTTASL